MEIRQSPHYGRYIVFTETANPGHTVLEVVDHQYVACNTCLKSQRPTSSQFLSCPSCNDIWYCSASCMESPNNWTKHTALECHARRKMKESFNDHDFTIDQSTEIKLALRILCLKLENEATFRNEVLLLIANRETIRTLDPPSYQLFEKMSQFALAHLQSSNIPTDYEELMNLICIIKCNTFGVWRKYIVHGKGLGLYPSLSLFNHSCVPNCAFVRHGLKLAIRTLDTVKANEELTISYIDVPYPYIDRMKDLKRLFWFDCTCKRCASKDEDATCNAIVSRIACKVDGCHGLLVPVKDDPNTRICSGCKNKTASQD